LLVVGENDANVALSFRNLPRVGVTDTDDLEVSDIIGARTVLTTSQVIEQLNTIGEGK
ncbi:MAG: 50S ribosomal protein L4, partial [Thermoleophilia bacterium]